MTNETKDISVDLIDEPKFNLRLDIDEQKLRELADSIKQFGLMNPVTVRPVGSRFELIAGLRRLRATKLLQLPVIRACVMSISELDADIMRVHENEFRHDTNPVETAVYIRRLDEVHKMPHDEIAKKYGRTTEWVEERLELLTFPQYILEAVAKSQIPLGAARWLAKIENENTRVQYTSWAVWHGITVRQARSWYDHTAVGSSASSVDELPQHQTAQGGGSAPLKADCVFCGENDELGNLFGYYGHTKCKDEKLISVSKNFEVERSGF